MKTIITASSVHFEPGETVASVVYEQGGVRYLAKVRQCGSGLLACPQCGEASVSLQSSYRGLRCSFCNAKGKRHAE